MMNACIEASGFRGPPLKLLSFVWPPLWITHSFASPLHDNLRSLLDKLHCSRRKVAALIRTKEKKKKDLRSHCPFFPEGYPSLRKWQALGQPSCHPDVQTPASEAQQHAQVDSWCLPRWPGSCQPGRGVIGRRHCSLSRRRTCTTRHRVQVARTWLRRQLAGAATQMVVRARGARGKLSTLPGGEIHYWRQELGPC